jgi:DNA (cytosine-5)-methyltransferase 1
MRQNFVKAAKEAPFDQLRIALTDCGIGYKVQPVLINAMHFGVPQHRPRVMLIAVRSDIAEALEIEVSENTWKSEYDSMPSILFHSRPVLAPIATHFGEDILTVKDAIWDLNDKGYAFAITNNKYLKERSEFTKNVREASMLVDDKSRKSIVFNHNLRNHTEHIKLRFRIYQYLQHNNITSKVFAYPKQEGLSPEIILSQLKEVLFEVKLPAKSPDGYLLANTLNELTDLIITLATKKHSQRPLKWNFPAPTIVSLPDDFVHPDKPRTLTVREMARFQSFPDGFEFRAKETTGSMRRRFEVPQYTQIGNAVPPLMAEAVGKIIFSVLEKYNSITNTREEIKKGNSGIHEKANSS